MATIPKVQLTGTRQLRELFPTLQVTNKFKRAIDRIFKELSPEIYLQLCPAWTVFKNPKTGKNFKGIISNSERGFFIIKTRTDRTGILKEDLAKNPERYIPYQDDEHCVYRQCKYERTDSASWGEFAYNIGKLIRNNPIFVENCSKCDGTGFLPHYAHISNGCCFQCMGVGKWFQTKAPQPAVKNFS